MGYLNNTSVVVDAILTDVLDRLMRPRLHEKVVEIEFPLFLDRRARAIHRDGNRSTSALHWHVHYW